jgi:hypothetical protein
VLIEKTRRHDAWMRPVETAPMPPWRQGGSSPSEDWPAMAQSVSEDIRECHDAAILREQLQRLRAEHSTQLEAARGSCPCHRAGGHKANAIANKSSVRDMLRTRAGSVQAGRQFTALAVCLARCKSLLIGSETVCCAVSGISVHWS